MDGWKLPWDGGCLCGDVRFRVTAAPLMTMACHCRGCQKLTASAFSLSIAIPAEGFTVTKGQTTLGGLHGPHRQNYCPRCKSWLSTNPHGMDAFVNVRATMLDNNGWVVPFIETGTVEKIGWATTPASRSYPQFPQMDDFPTLIQAFQRDAVRPV